MTLLLRFWPHLLVAAAILAAGVWINRLGYESGYNASEAKWQLRFDAANKALLAANERSRALETASIQISAQTEKAYAEKIASLNLRAADSERRIFGLVRQFAKRPSCGAVPPVPGASTEPHGASGSDERADRAGERISDTGKRCERDAAKVTLLQQWAREQLNLKPPPP